MLLASLCSLLTPQLEPPRFAEPFVDPGYLTRLEAPDARWLVLPRMNDWTHCGALVHDCHIVHLGALPLEDDSEFRPTFEHTIEATLPTLALDDIDLNHLVERTTVEFAGSEAVDLVYPVLDEQGLIEFSKVHESLRDESQLRFRAARLVDVDGVRFRFWTDTLYSAEAAASLLADACRSWTFQEGVRRTRSVLRDHASNGVGWRVRGLTVEEAATRRRLSLPPSWWVVSEPPKFPDAGETILSFRPAVEDPSSPKATVHVRRCLPRVVDADGNALWPERVDWTAAPALADALRKGWPTDARIDVFQTGDGAEEQLSTIVRVVVAETANAWLFVDFEFLAADPGADVVEWSRDALRNGVGDWEDLPERPVDEIIAAARTERMDTANRRWNGSELRDAEVGLTWTAPGGIWEPGDPETWATGGPVRFVATSWSDGVRLSIDVRADPAKSVERSLGRGLLRALGRRVDLETLGEPKAVDAGPGTESLRILVPDAFEDGDAALVQVSLGERRRVTLVVRGPSARLDALRPVFESAADGLRVDPELAAHALEMTDAGLVDRELGYAYAAPGGGWKVFFGGTRLDRRNGDILAAWKDPETDAWIAIAARHIRRREPQSFDVLAHSCTCMEFDEVFERHFTTVAGLPCDIVAGRRGAQVGSVATWRRGSTAFALTLGGETEQLDMLSALARFRLLE